MSWPGFVVNWPPMESSVLVVASPNRLPRIDCRGGVQARRTAPDTVHLVSAAATPLGGDTMRIRVIVERGAQLRLRSAAATVALPGVDTLTSHAHWEIDVTGTLDVDLEPTVVAASARHLSHATLRLHDDGRVRLRERVQIGRCNEREGFGRHRCRPIGMVVPCCGTGWNWVPGLWPTTSLRRRAPLSASCAIRRRHSPTPSTHGRPFWRWRVAEH